MLYLDKKDQLLLSWNVKMGQQKALTVQNTEIRDSRITGNGFNGKSYLVHTAVNEQYDLFLVSLISAQAKMNGILQVAGAFLLYFCLILLS